MQVVETQLCWCCCLDVFLQARLQKAKSSVRVDAMLFAPPNVGDQTFAEAFGLMVNARRSAGTDTAQLQQVLRCQVGHVLA